MLYNLIFENQFNIGPVYHGGTWDGLKPIKVTGKGALGIGAYFTPMFEIAQNYANESGGQVTKAFLKINKPLEIFSDDKREHPMVDALVTLGMNRQKADLFVEKQEEKYGYLGSQIKNLATKKGYDAIYQYFNGELREIVIWDKNQVKVSL